MKRSTTSHLRRQTELITAVPQSFAGLKDANRDLSTDVAAPNETGLCTASVNTAA